MSNIPKIIHYAWFGRGEKPALAVKCIESWKKFLPDYEIIEWNEDNFDLDEYAYSREAYENRKFAYVSDVARLVALYKFGGIYMDSDVEVLKSLDDLLNLKGFSGFQSETQIPTGIIAAEKGNKWIEDQLEYYKDHHFILADVNEKKITNVEIITDISLAKHGLVQNNSYQELKYGMVMYPMDYFCAKWANTGEVVVTDNTYTIHHFAGSWAPESARRNKKIYQAICRILGTNNTKRLYEFVKGKKL